jgi:hypothetical protein
VSTQIRATPRRRRPVWVPVLVVLAGVGVLFLAGFGLVNWLQTDATSSSDTTSEETTAAVGEVGTCETTFITPAEQLPDKSEVVLNVYNATKRNGLAATTAREFKKEGFRINKVSNDPAGKRIPEVAEIRFGPNAVQAAKLVEYYLAGAKMVELNRSGPRVDVALGRGFTTIADGGSVAAALASPQPDLTGPGCEEVEEVLEVEVQ